ncbi:hypothetical protein CDAR_380081 [Caerostris darwini]|uniref:Uncharacterized protein n=1 Tax=Caerostris darwini TaxID=1538125 RepID=A0AAV4WES5_9ARAC|nr:hypothetical protein CDAR_380081 [Caerostris darwini]
MRKPPTKGSGNLDNTTCSRNVQYTIYLGKDSAIASLVLKYADERHLAWKLCYTCICVIVGLEGTGGKVADITNVYAGRNVQQISVRSQSILTVALSNVEPLSIHTNIFDPNPGIPCPTEPAALHLAVIELQTFRSISRRL